MNLQIPDNNSKHKDREDIFFGLSNLFDFLIGSENSIENKLNPEDITVVCYATYKRLEQPIRMHEMANTFGWGKKKMQSVMKRLREPGFAIFVSGSNDNCGYYIDQHRFSGANKLIINKTDSSSDISSKIKKVAGVYLLYCEKGDLIYIGSSMNLSKRIPQSIQQRNAFYFSYIEIKNKANVYIIEAYLIGKLRTTKNKLLKHDGVTDIHIDVPEQSEKYLASDLINLK